jgi:hypothetical protein
MNINLRPNNERAQYALWSLLILVIVKVIVIVTYYMQYNLLTQWINGEPVDMLVAEDSDRRVMIISIIDVALRLGAIIAVISWFRRAYFNLHLRFQNLTYKEGWAAGGWFVPFMSLIVPYQIFNDLFTNTKQFLEKFNIPERHKLNGALLLIWWILWICSTLGANIFERLTREETDIDKLANYTLVNIGFSVVDIITLIMLIILIKAYSELEPIFHAKLDEEKDRKNLEDQKNRAWENDMPDEIKGLT